MQLDLEQQGGTASPEELRRSASIQEALILKLLLLL
jgi:hypothetical protein